MDTLSIESILYRDPYASRSFLGCFPSDRIPAVSDVTLPTYSFIVNVDKSNEPGSHWFAVYVTPRRVYIFDSFGTLPRVIRPWCRTLGTRRVFYNSTAHQSLNEVTCGGYAVFALCELARRHPFSSVIARFRSTRYDDAFIRAYLARTHHTLIPQFVSC